MIRKSIAIFAVIAFARLVTMLSGEQKSQDNDPLSQALESAKKNYISAIRKANDELLTSFDEQKRKIEADDKLKASEKIRILDQLNKERDAFATNSSNLPKSTRMITSVSNRKFAISAARNICEQAFEKAAQSYLAEKKDISAAKVVLADKDLFFQFAESTGNDAGKKSKSATDSDANTTKVRDYALKFDADSEVHIPGLSADDADPLTIECYVAIDAGHEHAIIIKMLGSPVTRTANLALAYRLEGGFDVRANILGKQVAAYGVLSADSGQRGPASGQAIEKARVESPPGDGHRGHVAAVWNGSEWRLYLHGRRCGGPVATTYGKGKKEDKGTFLAALPKNGSRYSGILDELRISRVARYGADFTPPIRLESDADTLALYHFDEGQGDMIYDSSGKRHHGKIVGGAKWIPGIAIGKGAKSK